MAALANRKPSRTNAQMSEEMRSRLIDATLECLASKGYAGTSTNDIVQAAGVTRGALTHHFATKSELIAEAAATVVSRRSRDLARLLEVKRDAPFEQRMRDLHAITREHFEPMIEFMVTARTDPQLRQEFSSAINRHFDQPDGRGGPLFGEFDCRPDPLVTQFVVNCFLRGLMLEQVVNPPELTEKIFDEFVEILALALARSS